MKEVEKNEIKRLSDRLDMIRHQMAGLSLVDSAEKYAELEKESVKLGAEIERLRVKQRLLAVEEVRERQKAALLVARLQREQLAAQTASRIDNAPQVIAARIRRRLFFCVCEYLLDFEIKM